ncbi:MAG: SDR family oxidoreductase [Deltaproteobacteria bacterium]|nr:SDR family oxidoreductase [Deltaproteobacteria bacterium]MBW2447437.1 SDR family oxidoreductase [Deltaproteobacteria bacterium]
MADAFDVVTGGAGFIGSHLSRSLVKQGRRVRIIDDLSTGQKERILDLLDEHGDLCEFREQDIKDIDALNDTFAGAETIYHQAALPSVPRSVNDPISSNDANIDGTLNVFVAARDARVRKVVYASSSSVYGDSKELPKRESMPFNPLSPYAITKCVGEMYGRVFSNLYGLGTVGLRYFNVFGPAQDPTSQYSAVIPKFITRMMKGEGPIIYGDGEQSRDFTFIENVVAANQCAARSEASGIAVNVACGERYTLNQLVGHLNDILGTSLEASYEDPRAGDVKHSMAGIERAAEAIGFEPRVGFEEGLRATVEFYTQAQPG